MVQLPTMQFYTREFIRGNIPVLSCGIKAECEQSDYLNQFAQVFFPLKKYPSTKL